MRYLPFIVILASELGIGSIGMSQTYNQAQGLVHHQSYRQRQEQGSQSFYSESPPHSQMPTRRIAALESVPWMRCVGQLPSAVAPVATATTSTLSTTGTASSSASPAQTGSLIRINFTIEPLNAEEISADTYLVDGRGRQIKQIGHAELLASSSSNSIALQSSQDSPFQFNLTVQPEANTNILEEGVRNHMLSGTIGNIGLFSGQSLGSTTVQCRYYAAAAGAVQAANGSSATSPSPTPSASTSTSVNSTTSASSTVNTSSAIGSN